MCAIGNRADCGCFGSIGDKVLGVKAAVCRAFGTPMKIEEVQIAEPNPGQVAVDIAACAICHSDISYADGIWGGKLPMVLGHEAAGTVTSAASGTGYSAGDRVLVTLLRSCGTCPACSGGQLTSCDQIWTPPPSPLSQDGSPVAQGLGTAAFAQKVVVDHSQLIKLPSDMPFATASLLACGVITGVGAVTNTAKLPPGANAVVIGAGGVGLNTVQGAAIAGAARIIAVDITQEKLDAALEFGATDGLLAGDDVAKKIRDMTGGRGADYVFVTVGAPPVFNEAPDYLAIGGAMVMVGMPPSGAMAEYEPAKIAANNQRLLGSRMGQTVLARDVPWLIDLYRQGRLKLDELISGRYALAEINEAIADTRKGLSRRNIILIE